MKKTKIGLLGGTFDPIHYGHLVIAENAAIQYDLEQVIFIPTGYSPHKKDSEIETVDHRMEMLMMALKDNPTFQFSTMEIESHETSYTYRTLEILHDKFPDWEIYFILGADSLDYLEHWVKPLRIFELAHILAAVRDDMNIPQMQMKAEKLSQQFQAKISFINTPNIAISSRDIRTRIKQNQSIRYLVPNEVRRYILNKHLYQQ